VHCAEFHPGLHACCPREPPWRCCHSCTTQHARHTPTQWRTAVAASHP
jgi:hypothetical protein